MKKLVFAFPGNEKLSAGIINKTGLTEGKFVYRHFPDGESYLQLQSDVEGAEIIIVCTLHDPDNKILPLLFFASELKEKKARSITLIAPYIAYMRQDKEFKPGEIISSRYFAKILSGYFDRIITVDPHLHRIHNMAEIYSVPCTVIHASNLISEWIKENSKNAVLIGPDEESKQWFRKSLKMQILLMSFYKKQGMEIEKLRLPFRMWNSIKNILSFWLMTLFPPPIP